MILKSAEEIEKATETIALTTTKENGMPLNRSTGELLLALMELRETADMAKDGRWLRKY